MPEQGTNIDFQLQGQTYSVPIDKVQEFMTKMPNATISSSGKMAFEFNNTPYEVPREKVQEFMTKMPNAKLSGWIPDAPPQYSVKTSEPGSNPQTGRIVKPLREEDIASIQKAIKTLPEKYVKSKDFIDIFSRQYAASRGVDPNAVKMQFQKPIWEQNILEAEDRYRQTKDHRYMAYAADLHRKLGNNEAAQQAEVLAMPQIGNGDYMQQPTYTPTRLGFAGHQGFTTERGMQTPDTEKNETSRYLKDIADNLEQHAPGVAQMHMISGGIDKMTRTPEVTAKEGTISGILNGAVGAGESILGVILGSNPSAAGAGFMPFDFAQSNLPPKAAAYLMPVSKFIREHYEEENKNLPEDQRVPAWAENIGFVGDLALLGVLHAAKSKIQTAVDWHTAPDKYFNELKKDPEAMKALFKEAETRAIQYQDDPSTYRAIVRDNAVHAVEGLKENQQTWDNTKKTAEPYHPDPVPQTLPEVKLGTDVIYKGQRGILDRADDGAWTVTFDEGDKTVELPVKDKVNPAETLDELGISVAPEVSEANIARALADREQVGHVEYKGKKYFVSLGNSHNPADTAGDVVYEVLPDGKAINRFDQHQDPAFAANRKLAIINEYLSQQGLPKRSSLYEPWRKNVEAGVEIKNEPKRQAEPSATKTEAPTTTEPLSTTSPEVKSITAKDKNESPAELNAKHAKLSSDLLVRQKELLNNGVRDFTNDAAWNAINAELNSVESKISNYGKSSENTTPPATESVANIVESTTDTMPLKTGSAAEGVLWHEGFGANTKGDAVYLENENAAKDNSNSAKPYRYKVENAYNVKTDHDFHIIDKWIKEAYNKIPNAKWHPDVTKYVNDKLRENGYDALILHPEAFDSEYGYQHIESTYGNPQTIILDKSKVTEESNPKQPDIQTDMPSSDGAPAYEVYSRQDFIDEFGEDSVGAYDDKLREDLKNGTIEEGIKGGWLVPEAMEQALTEAGIDIPEWLSEEPEIDPLESAKKNRIRLKGVTGHERYTEDGTPVDWLLDEDLIDLINKLKKVKESLGDKWEGSKFQRDDVLFRDEATKRKLTIPEDANTKQGQAPEAMGNKPETGPSVRERNAKGKETSGERKQDPTKKEKVKTAPATKEQHLKDIKKFNSLPKRQRSTTGANLRAKIMADAKKLGADIRMEEGGKIAAYGKDGKRWKLSGEKRTPEEIEAAKQQVKATRELFNSSPKSLRAAILQKLLKKMSLSAADVKRYTGHEPSEFPKFTVGEKGTSFHSLWEELRGEQEAGNLSFPVPEDSEAFNNQLADIITEYKDRVQMREGLEAEQQMVDWREMGFRSESEYQAWHDHMIEMENAGLSPDDVHEDDIANANADVAELTDEEVSQWLSDLDTNRPTTPEEINKFYEEHGITTEQPEQPSADEPQKTGSETSSNERTGTKSPEQAEHEKRIAAAQQRVEAATEALKQKRAEIDKALMKDQPDLFGDRAAAQGVMIDERADASQRAKILDPFNRELDDARAELKRLQEQKVTGTDEMNFDQPQQAVIAVPGLSKLLEQDVKPRLQVLGERTSIAAKGILDAISPLTRSSTKVKDFLFKMKGERDKSMVMLDGMLNASKKMFSNMDQQEQIGFIDRMKRGQAQPTPELQAVADTLRALDDQLYAELQKYNPDIAWLQDHFRVLWKTIPGMPEKRGFFGFGKRPLMGSKGMFKMHTLVDMSEGISKGGAPVTYNPVEMFELAYADAMKFITAQKMWDGMRKDKTIRFIESGTKPPDGFEPVDVMVNDTARRKYLKIKQPTGATQTNALGQPTPITTDVTVKGQWYIDQHAGRLLNNFLSRDLWREDTPMGSVGKTALELKNVYTTVELGLSPFHAVAEGIEAMSSQMGLGFRKMINTGLLKGDVSQIAKGAVDVITAPFAPKSLFSLGRETIKYLTKEQFKNTPEAKSFLAKHPDAGHYFDLLFEGGGKLEVSEEYKLKTVKALSEAYKNNNYVGAGIRALPAINEAILSPLFNHYIPNLKVGIFMREIPQALAENAQRIREGKTTEAEVARKTWAFVEDRIGEMNFDNLFWDRTFKTSAQLMFRSVTWKLGNLRAMGGALPEQGMEIVSALREGRTPNLSPKTAWLFGLTTMATLLGTITQYGFTGTYPESIKDIVAPRINKDDPNERVVVPTYWKDAMHLKHDPWKYLTSSFSGIWSKMMDLWNPFNPAASNRDFYNYQIYNPNDKLFGKKGKDMLTYLMPKPFSIASFEKMKEKGEPMSKQALSFMGFLRAPGYLTHSQIENAIFDKFHIYNMDVKPLDKKAGDEAKKAIMEEYRKGNWDKATKLASDAVKAKLLREPQLEHLFRNMSKDQEPAMFMLSQLPKHEQEYLYSEMTPDEKKHYAWVVFHYPEDRASYVLERFSKEGKIDDVLTEMVQNNVNIHDFAKELKKQAGEETFAQINNDFKRFKQTPQYNKLAHEASVSKHRAKQLIRSLKKSLE